MVEEGGEEMSGCHINCLLQVCSVRNKVEGIKSFAFTTIPGSSHSQNITTSAVLLAVSTTFSAVHV